MTTLINSHTNIFPQVVKTHHNDYYFSNNFNEVEDWRKIEILTAAHFPIFLHADRRNGTESFEEAYKRIVVIGKMRGQLYKESERLLYETQ